MLPHFPRDDLGSRISVFSMTSDVTSHTRRTDGTVAENITSPGLHTTVARRLPTGRQQSHHPKKSLGCMPYRHGTLASSKKNDSSLPYCPARRPRTLRTLPINCSYTTKLPLRREDGIIFARLYFQARGLGWTAAERKVHFPVSHPLRIKSRCAWESPRRRAMIL